MGNGTPKKESILLDSLNGTARSRNGESVKMRQLRLAIFTVSTRGLSMSISGV